MSLFGLLLFSKVQCDKHACVFMYFSAKNKSEKKKHTMVLSRSCSSGDEVVFMTRLSNVTARW